MSTSLDPIIMLWDLVAIPRYEIVSSLALMHIHYQVKIVLDEVVNLFATNTHPKNCERDS